MADYAWVDHLPDWALPAMVVLSGIAGVWLLAKMVGWA